MPKKLALFGDTIDPACQYCEYGRASGKPPVLICPKMGEVAPHFCCRRFRYAPLKRIPRRAAPLPCYSKEDFTV